MSLAAHIDIMDLISTSATLKKVSSTRGGEYAGACPFCGGKDRFHVWVQDNTWSCRQCVDSNMTPQDAISYVARRDNVNFIEACNRLGIDLENGNGSHATSKRGYSGMQDYAEQHGLDAIDLEKCGWIETTCKDRPALEFNTRGGKRWRFLDGDTPSYISEPGFTRSWYHLNDKVITQAREANSPLFLCNGEVSMLAARFHGVPAIAIAGGSEKRIPDDLLTELLTRWDGRIAIALDCDTAGRKASQDISEQLGDRGVVVDLGLMDGQDLADYVNMNGSHSLRYLKRLIPLPADAPITSREAARLNTDSLDINHPVEGKPIIMPYEIYHEYGGYALVCMPGKLTCAVAPSGHGKTSWLNGAIDTLLRRGDNGVGIMPEFDTEEYQWDRIQRYSGFDNAPFIQASDMMLWKLWRWEHQNNIPMQQRKGRKLSRDEQRVITHIDNMVESWNGAFKLYPLNTTLEDAFEEMGDYVIASRGTENEVTFAAFDYIQILNVRGTPDDDNVHEYVMGLIKRFCMRYKIHGFVTSQVNKTADKNVRESGKVLTGADMRYVRDDKVNCLITLNPMYDTMTGEMVQVGDTGCYACVANISKNTKGRKGKMNQMVDFKHLTWLDQTYTNQLIDLTEE